MFEELSTLHHCPDRAPDTFARHSRGYFQAPQRHEKTFTGIRFRERSRSVLKRLAKTLDIASVLSQKLSYFSNGHNNGIHRHNVYDHIRNITTKKKMVLGVQLHAEKLI